MCAQKLKAKVTIRQIFDFSQEFFTRLGDVTTRLRIAVSNPADPSYHFDKPGKNTEKCAISGTHENDDCNMMES